MADRTIATHSNEDPDQTPVDEFAVLRIERSSAGQPGLLFIIENHHAGSIDSESCVSVPRGDQMLAPARRWLESGDSASDPRRRSGASHYVLARYTETPNERGFSSVLRIEKGPDGAPGLMFVIEDREHGTTYREARVSVADGAAFLEPVQRWIDHGLAPLPRHPESGRGQRSTLPATVRFPELATSHEAKEESAGLSI